MRLELQGISRCFGIIVKRVCVRSSLCSLSLSLLSLSLSQPDRLTKNKHASGRRVCDSLIANSLNL